MNINNRYLIKTPFGYKSFSNISKSIKQCIKIYFNDNSHISCSIDHPFIIDQKIVYANQLKITDTFIKENNIVTIIKIENIGQQQCYDIIQVEDCHCYFANGLVSHNCFLGSAQTLIDADKIIIMQKLAKQLNRQYKEIQLHPEYQQTKIKIYAPPSRGRAYIIGADPATGSDSDYHAMCVWDITNLYNIQLVADFYGNKLPPKFFAYILAKAGTIYNKAYIAIQNNGVSYSTLDRLMTDFQYENIIHDGGSKLSIGIASSDDKKLAACLHFKQFIEDPLRKIIIPNKLLLQQMQHFERRDKQGKMPKFACFNGHDDFIMSMIWAFYYLKSISLQNFYDVMKYGTDKFGNQVPLVVSSSQNPSEQNIKKLIQDIDKIFNKTTKSYALQMEQLKYNIQQSQAQLMNNFIQSRIVQQNSQKQINNIDPDTGEETFQFDGFII